MEIAIVTLTILLICCILAVIYLSMKTSTRRSDCARLETMLNERDKEIARISSELHIATNYQHDLENIISKLRSENGSLQERNNAVKEEIAMLRKESTETFENAARKILEETAQKSKQSHTEQLAEMLRPFGDKLSEFRNVVEKVHSEDLQQRASLRERMQEIVEANATIGKEANELSKALRGNAKVQGDWGELALSQILEKSGLIKGVHYEEQVARNADGNTLRNDDTERGLRMDVVVKLPEGKNIILDSKTSITAYIEYVNAPDKETRDAALKAHIASVRSHVKELVTANYQKFYKDSVEFVLMFIPNEGAYTAAMQGDNALWMEAYEQHVVIVSPVNLLSSLRLVGQLWQHDKQTKNAIEIAKKAGDMYDKFYGFISDMETIHKNLESVEKSYDNAMTKLTGKGGLTSRAEALKQLGAKAQKQLPERLLSEEK